MPRIPQSDIDRGISTDIRTAAPQQTDALARAIGNLGKTGEALFAKLKEKQDTSDFLDWRHEYDKTFRENRAQFMQDLNRAELNGDYNYSSFDLAGNPVQRQGNIFDDRTNLTATQSELASKGDFLAMSENAKRHYTAKENQMDAKLSLDISSYMNRKRRDKVDSILNDNFNQMIKDLDTGIPPTDKEMEEILKKVSSTSMEAQVLGTDAITQKRGRFIASLGEAMVSSVDTYGDSPELRAAINKVRPQMDSRTRKRFDISLERAKARYTAKIDDKLDKQLVTAKSNDIGEYKNVKPGVMPTAISYMSNGSLTSDKIIKSVDLIANAAHMDNRLASGVSKDALDSIEDANKLFEQVKDTPLVKKFGEENYRQLLINKVKERDFKAAKLLHEEPSAYVVTYSESVSKKFEDRQPTLAANEMKILFNQLGVAKADRNYGGQEPFVKLEKEWWKENGKNPSLVTKHLNMLSTELGEIGPQTIKELINAGAFGNESDHYYILQDLGADNALAAEIAQAGSQFEANKEHASFAVEGEKGLGITKSQLNKLISTTMKDDFMAPRNTNSDSIMLYDGLHDSLQKLVYARLTKDTARASKFSHPEASEVIRDTIEHMKSYYRPINGDKGSVTFKTETLKRSGRDLDKLEAQVKSVMDNPAKMLDQVDKEPAYEVLREILREQVGEDSPSVSALDNILKEKNPEDRKEMFIKTFGDSLSISRSGTYGNKIALLFGKEGVQKPLVMRGNVNELKDKTLNGRSILVNPDGSVSTEETATVFIDDKVYNIPTIYGGKRVSEEEAIKIIKKNNFADPDTNRQLLPFASLDAAKEEAEARSKFKGIALEGLLSEGFTFDSEDEFITALAITRLKDMDNEIAYVEKQLNLKGRFHPQILERRLNELKQEKENLIRIKSNSNLFDTPTTQEELTQEELTQEELTQEELTQEELTQEKENLTGRKSNSNLDTPPTKEEIAALQEEKERYLIEYPEMKLTEAFKQFQNKNITRADILNLIKYHPKLTKRQKNSLREQVKLMDYHNTVSKKFWKKYLESRFLKNLDKEISSMGVE